MKKRKNFRQEVMIETMNRLETREIKVVNRFDKAEKNCDEKR